MSPWRRSNAAGPPAAAKVSEAVLAAAGRVFALSDLKPAVRESAAPVDLPDRPGILDLEVRGLRFTYPGQPSPALDGVDLRLAPGARVAIVGPSGAGKSTLAALLLRLWEIDEGAIFFNGVELRSLRSDAARSLMAALVQQPTLFNTSLRENLLLANPQASESDMRRVLHHMQLGAFLETLPSGLAP